VVGVGNTGLECYATTFLSGNGSRMSDFFTRLAERTLGLAPTIQPITPSLFAPESDLPGDMLLEITEESEESVVADNLSKKAESPVLAQDAATHLTYPTQRTQLTRSASMPVQYEVSQPFPTTSSATAPRQSRPALATMAEQQATRMLDSLTIRTETSTTGTKVQPTRRGSQRTKPVTSAVPAIPTPSVDTQTSSFAPMNAHTLRVARRTDEITEPVATFLASSVIDDPFTHDTHDSMVSATSEQQTADAQLTTRAAMPHEQSVSHHTLVGVPVSNLPSMTGFPQTQQTLPAQLETPSPEPDIQVTIGRVEVRAITAPPTSARTQQQSDRPPAMSLDEYLRQQERGGRR
jgi:hypothetical protein